MKQYEEVFFSVVRAALWKTPVEVPQGFADWNKVLKLAKAQTLTGLARTLQRDGESANITKDVYFETLQTYSNSHRRVNEDGKTVCWIDENLNPFTGDWISRTMLLAIDYKYKERGKDYNHSSFCDLVISGLVGVQPQADGSIVIEPLIPEGEWDWFSLSRISCAGKEISVIYDRTGEH